MTKVKNLIGLTFSKLTVIERAANDKHGKAEWKCQCECGIEKTVNGRALISGNTKSCGCSSTEFYDNKAKLEGKKFGRLTVIKFEGVNKHRKSTWLCECECGNTVVCPVTDLTTGNTRSCGCYRSDYVSSKNTSHGLSDTPEYQSWMNIKWRVKHNEEYLKKRIKVCENYKESFPDFLADMGKMPPNKTTVDRIDTYGHYSCGRCEQCKKNEWTMNLRWADWTEQANNKTNNLIIEYKGQKKTVSEWSRETGLPESRIRSRYVVLKWSPERIFKEVEKNQPRQNKLFETE